MSNVKWIIEELRDIPIDWMGLIRRWMLIGAIIRAVFEGIRDYIDISYGYILMGALAVYYFMVFFRLLYVYSDKNIQIIINNALTSACAQGNIEMVTYLADKCVHDVNYDFKPELDAASMCGNLRVIDFLKGRFKNAQDNDYYVVVHPV
jgi:hypothetical protein